MEISQDKYNFVDDKAELDAEIMEECAVMARSQRSRGLIGHMMGTVPELDTAIM